ncbi:conserved hypothetical protein [Trichinella spiralis]|uniref:hypothetical protein n=1 Tax=Trichinella spiralis TaxID=6334 RepID=UPI0001EFE99F|nr:conserved hypothetical protein [Trichinella spiralis]
MVLASGRPELPTAPSRNSTLRHRRSGPPRPPRVVRRQRSWGPVSPRAFATLRPRCPAGNSPPRGFRLAHKRKHGRSGVLSRRCFARPKDPGGCGQTLKTLSIPSSRADEGADDAPGDIRPLHRVDFLGILSPYARSPDIESRLPWFAPCLSSWTGPPSGTSHTLPPYAPHHRTGSPWRRPLPTPPQLI